MSRTEGPAEQRDQEQAPREAKRRVADYAPKCGRKAPFLPAA
jgi:hypothetical protein